jgi:hypothetical protein
VTCGATHQVAMRDSSSFDRLHKTRTASCLSSSDS